MSRTRNSAWNLAAGIVYSVASAAAGLIAAPLLLRWLGAERLGASTALADWFGYLALFELGIGGAMMASLARRVGLGDRAAVTRMLAVGLRSYRWVAFAQLGAGVALVWALPSLISRTQLSSSELRTAGAAALGVFAFTPLLVFRALSEARQRGYRNWLLLTLQALTSTGLCLFAAGKGWGLLGQSVALSVAQLPTLFVLARDGRRAYGEVWAEPERADRDELRALSWPTLAHGLTDRVGLLSDNVLIAWIMGPRAVVVLVFTQQLAAMAQSQLKGFGAATWAGLSELHARGDTARFHIRLLELTGIVSGLSLAVLTPIAAFNQSFVRLWVGDDAFAGEMVTVFGCFNALLWALYALWGWALLGTGQIRRWVPFAMAATAVNVIGSVMWTVRLGLVGPLLGTTTGLLVVTSWALPLTLHRAFGIPSRALWRTALAPLRWGVPYAAALWALSRYWPPAAWPGLVAAMGLGTAAGLGLWWNFSVARDERREWKARLRRVVRHR